MITRKLQVKSRKPKEQKVIFLVGPTASGKTRVAVKLAKKINAEIISCDSMQVYKGMRIISSQPEAILRKAVKHHLTGAISPEKEYNVAQYRKDALKIVKAIIKRGKVPLFVGGTGLYMIILLDGIFKDKAQDQAARQRLYREAAQKGNACLYHRLEIIDPVAAGKIHPNDTRRIVRALEAFEASGRPISELQKERRGLFNDFPVQIFCLNMAREELYQRINVRTEKMFKDGLLAEVRKLLKLKLSRTAACAIGIRELGKYFSGELDLAQAKQLMQKNTRNYAKRQLTWFRKDKRITWLEAGEAGAAAGIVQKIVKLLT